MDTPAHLKVFYIVISEDVTLVGKSTSHEGDKNLIIFQPFFKLNTTLPLTINLAFNMGVEIPNPYKNQLKGYFVSPEGDQIGRDVDINRILLQGEVLDKEDSEYKLIGGNVSATFSELTITDPGEYKFVVKLNNEVELGEASLIVRDKDSEDYE